MVEQGDIIKIEGVKDLALVISKDTYNESEMAIILPILKRKCDSSFEVEINIEETPYYVMCDKVKQIDLKPRIYSKKGSISYIKRILVIDMVQAIVDYI